MLFLAFFLSLITGWCLKSIAFGLQTGTDRIRSECSGGWLKICRIKFFTHYMHTLFPIEPDFPEGFSYSPGFLTEDEEMGLYAQIQKLELHNFNFQGFTANRKVASFGYDYSFENASLSKGKDIPRIFDFLIEKVGKLLSITPGEFAELLVTEYPVGSVINWHRDAPPFDIIAGISLMADCTFRLRPHDRTKQNRASVISFPVKRRSLYIIRGSARSDWQHSIAPVKQTRYSITLRTLRS